MNENSVGQFFDTLTEDYTAMIERCFPRYREMLWALLEYLPSVGPHPTILELGCGTGNLSVLLRKCFPAATIHLVDLSGESLEVCRNRLPDDVSITFEQQDFRALEYKAESFDVIASSISIHHLKSKEKRALFGQIHEWLKPQETY